MLTVELDTVSLALIAAQRALLALGELGPAALGFAALVGLVSWLGFAALRA